MATLYRTLWGDEAPLPPAACKPIPMTAEEKAVLSNLRSNRKREQDSKREQDRRKAGNPLIVTYGNGPRGRTCSDCQHLIVKTWDKRYFKCALRGDTNGSATDHRRKWPACGGYCGPEEAEHGADEA